ncbi:MAG TPA: hypothetical protein VFV50_11135 [Bdellovibrionales bacterium]|nr:hypothetical protein [Bdellovibrionales bacterium]
MPQARRISAVLQGAYNAVWSVMAPVGSWMIQQFWGDRLLAETKETYQAAASLITGRPVPQNRSAVQPKTLEKNPGLSQALGYLSTLSLRDLQAIKDKIRSLLLEKNLEFACMRSDAQEAMMIQFLVELSFPPAALFQFVRVAKSAKNLKEVYKRMGVFSRNMDDATARLNVVHRYQGQVAGNSDNFIFSNFDELTLNQQLAPAGQARDIERVGRRLEITSSEPALISLSDEYYVEFYGAEKEFFSRRPGSQTRDPKKNTLVIVGDDPNKPGWVVVERASGTGDIIQFSVPRQGFQANGRQWTATVRTSQRTAHEIRILDVTTSEGIASSVNIEKVLTAIQSLPLRQIENLDSVRLVAWPQVKPGGFINSDRAVGQTRTMNLVIDPNRETLEEVTHMVSHEFTHNFASTRLGDIDPDAYAEVFRRDGGRYVSRYSANTRNETYRNQISEDVAEMGALYIMTDGGRTLSAAQRAALQHRLSFFDGYFRAHPETLRDSRQFVTNTLRGRGISMHESAAGLVIVAPGGAALLPGTSRSESGRAR